MFCLESTALIRSTDCQFTLPLYFLRSLRVGRTWPFFCGPIIAYTWCWLRLLTNAGWRSCSMCWVSRVYVLCLYGWGHLLLYVSSYWMCHGSFSWISLNFHILHLCHEACAQRPTDRVSPHLLFAFLDHRATEPETAGATISQDSRRTTSSYWSCLSCNSHE